MSAFQRRRASACADALPRPRVLKVGFSGIEALTGINGRESLPLIVRYENRDCARTLLARRICCAERNEINAAGAWTRAFCTDHRRARTHTGGVRRCITAARRGDGFILQDLGDDDIYGQVIRIRHSDDTDTEHFVIMRPNDAGRGSGTAAIGRRCTAAATTTSA